MLHAYEDMVKIKNPIIIWDNRRRTANGVENPETPFISYWSNTFEKCNQYAPAE